MLAITRKISSSRVCISHAAAVTPARLSVVRKAGGEPSAPETPSTSQPVFYGGDAKSEAEWKASSAKANATTPLAPVMPAVGMSPAKTATLPSFTDVMGFSGSAPEVINGRLCMLAVVAALGAELASGQSVLRQLAQEPTLIVVATTLIIAGSLVPLFNGTKNDQAFGPFTPAAEMTNGRAAMLGLAALLAIETFKGTAFL